MKVEIGYTLRIYSMKGEPQYNNKVGIVKHIDDAGQIHGTWGGCALIPGEDKFEIVMDENKTATDKRIDTEKLTKILRNVDDCHCNGICDNRCCKCAEYASAKRAVDMGFGDIKKAKADFAEQLYDKLDSASMCFGREPERDAGVYMSDIKNVIKELLGEFDI